MAENAAPSAGEAAGSADEAEAQAGLSASHAEEAAASAEDAAASAAAMHPENYVAQAFSASSAYSAGAYVMHDGYLYRLTADHDADVTWENTAKVQVKVADDVGDLKSETRTDIGELQGQLDGLQEQIDSAGLLKFNDNEPSGTTWQVGNLNNNGGYYSKRNVVRTNSAVSFPVGSTVSCDDGYLIRVYKYTSADDITSFTSMTGWVTEYTATETGYIRLLIGDSTNYLNTDYVLENTDYKNNVNWHVVTGTIQQDIAALQTEVNKIPDKTDGGYVDITWQRVFDGRIDTPAAGQTVSYTPAAENAAYSYLIRDVKSGDKFRVSGSGGMDARLWAFVNASDEVVTRYTTYNGENLIITAPADGKLILNFVAGNGKVTPKVEMWVGRTEQYALLDEQRADYLMQTKTLDVLTAFTNIVCCGDSLTRSVVYTGVDGQGGNITRMAHRTWPEILEAKTGANTTFIAFGGFDAKTWWENYNGKIAAADNQLAIIYLGTNGSLTDTIDTDAPGMDKSGYDVTTNTGAYCKIVKAWLDVGARVLLVHVKKTTNSIWATNAVIDKIAEKFGVAVVDVPLLKDVKYHSWPDGAGQNTMHYNDFGYAAFADLLMRCVDNLDDTMMKRLIPNDTNNGESFFKRTRRELERLTDMAENMCADIQEAFTYLNI